MCGLDLTMSETEPLPSQKKVESEMKQRLQKSGLVTGLEYYSTMWSHMNLGA